MGTAWDIAGAVDTTNNLDVSTEDTLPVGITFNSAGTRLYLAGDSTNTIYQYNLSIPWDISTASYLIGAGGALLETTTGSPLLETTTGSPLLETGAGAGVNLNVSGTTTNLGNLNINPTEDKYVYLVADSNIYHYGMEIEGDISTASLLIGGKQFITANLSNISNVSAIVLGRHNLVQGTTLRIYLYSSPNQIGEVYDSGVINLENEESGTLTSTWGDFTWGSVPWGTIIEEFESLKNFVHWIDPQIISVQSVKIEFSVPTNQIEIGRLFVGTYIEPEFGATYGHNITWREASNQYRSEEGTLRTNHGLPYRRLEFSLEATKSTDRTLLQHSFRDLGLREDFFISMFPNDLDINKRLDYSAIVKLIEEPKFTEFAPLYYKSKYIMEEV
jgi:hypothetical protein